MSLAEQGSQELVSGEHAQDLHHSRRRSQQAAFLRVDHYLHALLPTAILGIIPEKLYLHTLHHRALRHGFLAHLHVLHHVLHHLIIHLCLSHIHGRPLLHHLGDNSGHQVQLFVLRRAVHLGDLHGEFGVLRLHVCHHFLFLFLHLLAALHHIALHHHLPLRRLGGSRLDGSPDGQG